MKYKDNEVVLLLDHLDIKFESFSIIKDFDLDNFKSLNESNHDSCKITLDNIEFTVKSSGWKGYAFSYIFDFVHLGEITSGFGIGLGEFKNGIKTSNKLTIYSSFIKVLGHDKMKMFIETAFNTNNFIGLRRFDICLDLPVGKKELADTFLEKPKSAINLEKSGCAETYYWGCRKNRTTMIRCYNKRLEIFKYNKTHIYNLGDIKELNRVEVEFGDKFINSFNKSNNIGVLLDYKTLLSDDEKLYKQLFFSRVADKIGYFSEAKFNEFKFNFDRSGMEEDLERFFMKTNQLPDWYQKQGLGLFKKIYKTLGPKGLYPYIFEDRKNLDRNIKDLFKIHRNHKKIIITSTNQKIKKSTKKNVSVSLEDKIDLLNNIQNSLLSNDDSISNISYLELQKTFNIKLNN